MKLKRIIAVITMMMVIMSPSLHVSADTIEPFVGVQAVQTDDAFFSSDKVSLEGITISKGSIKNVVDATEKFISQNKGASKPDIDKYVTQQLQKYSVVQTRGLLDDLIAGKLNSQEQALYNQDKVKGLKVLNSAATARSETLSRYKGNTQLIGGNGDAFRHALWNALMVQSVGSTWAKKWADAHEYGEAGNTGIHRDMDLKNNSTGRSIGSSNISLPSYVIYDIVFSDVKNGKMVRIVNNKLVPTDKTTR